MEVSGREKEVVSQGAESQMAEECSTGQSSQE